MVTYDDNQKATRAHCRLAFSAQPQKFFLPLLVGLHGSTDTTARKSAIEEKMFWKVTLPSALIFCAKDVRTINLTVSFYLYLYLQPREKCFFFRRWVTWSWHNIQRWKRILYFVSLAAWLRFRHAKLTAGGKGRIRILAIECVSFFFFFSSYRFSIFSRSNAHTHTNKEGAKTRGKAERRQRAVRFTRFLDYRLMFDSGRSFSLKYDLIRPPDSLIIPRIVASLTSRSASVLFPLAFWHLNLL